MSARKMLILLVEDDPDIAAIVTMSLHLDPGLTVAARSTAAETLRLLDAGPRPDLVLMDNKLPDMEGTMLAEAIRMRGPSAPPIAFLTASVREADRTGFTNSGAVGVIAKPFDPLTLAQQVRALLPTPSE